MLSRRFLPVLPGRATVTGFPQKVHHVKSLCCIPRYVPSCLLLSSLLLPSLLLLSPLLYLLFYFLLFFSSFSSTLPSLSTYFSCSSFSSTSLSSTSFSSTYFSSTLPSLLLPLLLLSSLLLLLLFYSLFLVFFPTTPFLLPSTAHFPQSSLLLFSFPPLHSDPPNTTPPSLLPCLHLLFSLLLSLLPHLREAQ